MEYTHTPSVTTIAVPPSSPDYIRRIDDLARGITANATLECTSLVVDNSPNPNVLKQEGYTISAKQYTGQATLVSTVLALVGQGPLGDAVKIVCYVPVSPALAACQELNSTTATVIPTSRQETCIIYKLA
ncbi:hypothetical protein HDV00_001721 [Rhizophlyctis rosea]|nr:hypothetical protein HDV00_001721 [Rhizophlyctis rosea]